jgi:hypothetical protein
LVPFWVELTPNNPALCFDCSHRQPHILSPPTPNIEDKKNLVRLMCLTQVKNTM